MGSDTTLLESLLDHLQTEVSTYEVINGERCYSASSQRTVNEIRNKIISSVQDSNSEINPRNITWIPDLIHEQSLLSSEVIEFCDKWNVLLGVISKEDFAILNNLFTSNNEKRFITFENKLYGIDIAAGRYGYEKSIYFNVEFDYKKTNPNSTPDALALHELCHVLMQVHPKIINESASPFYSLWYRFLKYCSVDHRIISGDDFFKKM